MATSPRQSGDHLHQAPHELAGFRPTPATTCTCPDVTSARLDPLQHSPHPAVSSMAHASSPAMHVRCSISVPCKPTGHVPLSRPVRLLAHPRPEAGAPAQRPTACPSTPAWTSFPRLGELSSRLQHSLSSSASTSPCEASGHQKLQLLFLRHQTVYFPCHGLTLCPSCSVPMSIPSRQAMRLLHSHLVRPVAPTTRALHAACTQR